jgi:predicted phosphodiesterase
VGTTASTIGVIGDVHQEDAALEIALAILKEKHVDLLLCSGDVADGPGDFERCCQLLQAAGVAVVRGNHDRWLLAGSMRDLTDALSVAKVSDRSRAFLSSLPATREYSTIAGRLLLCHGLGADDMSMVKPDDYGYGLDVNGALQEILRSRTHRLVVAGHSHVRMVRRFAEADVTIINAGTLLRDRRPGFLFVDLAEKVVQAFDIDASGADPSISYDLE